MMERMYQGYPVDGTCAELQEHAKRHGISFGRLHYGCRKQKHFGVLCYNAEVPLVVLRVSTCMSTMQGQDVRSCRATIFALEREDSPVAEVSTLNLFRALDSHSFSDICCLEILLCHAA